MNLIRSKKIEPVSVLNRSVMGAFDLAMKNKTSDVIFRGEIAERGKPSNEISNSSLQEHIENTKELDALKRRISELENEVEKNKSYANFSQLVLNDLEEGMNILTRVMKRGFTQEYILTKNSDKEHNNYTTQSKSARLTNGYDFIPIQPRVDSNNTLTDRVPLHQNGTTEVNFEEFKIWSTHEHIESWNGDVKRLSSITHDEERLTELEGLIGSISMGFCGLSNVCKMLYENANLTAIEAVTALDEMQRANARAQEAEVKFLKAEKACKKLYFQNTALQAELEKDKREKRLLTKEVKILLHTLDKVESEKKRAERRALLFGIETHERRLVPSSSRKNCDDDPEMKTISENNVKNDIKTNKDVDIISGFHKASGKLFVDVKNSFLTSKQKPRKTEPSFSRGDLKNSFAPLLSIIAPAPRTRDKATNEMKVNSKEESVPNETEYIPLNYGDEKYDLERQMHKSKHNDEPDLSDYIPIVALFVKNDSEKQQGNNESLLNLKDAIRDSCSLDEAKQFSHRDSSTAITTES